MRDEGKIDRRLVVLLSSVVAVGKERTFYSTGREMSFTRRTGRELSFTRRTGRELPFTHRTGRELPFTCRTGRELSFTRRTGSELSSLVALVVSCLHSPH